MAVAWKRLVFSDEAVALQAATPGTAQTGHVNVTGTLKAGQAVVGDGTGSSALAYPGVLANNAGVSQVSAKDSSDGVEIGMFAHPAGTGYFGTYTNHPLVIRANNTDAVYVTAGRNVGINKETPLSKFAVVGLPTSASGLTAGDVWIDTSAGNVLKIVT